MIVCLHVNLWCSGWYCITDTCRTKIFSFPACLPIRICHKASSVTPEREGEGGEGEGGTMADLQAVVQRFPKCCPRTLLASLRQQCPLLAIHRSASATLSYSLALYWKEVLCTCSDDSSWPKTYHHKSLHAETVAKVAAPNLWTCCKILVLCSIECGHASKGDAAHEFGMLILLQLLSNGWHAEGRLSRLKIILLSCNAKDQANMTIRQRSPAFLRLFQPPTVGLRWSQGLVTTWLSQTRKSIIKWHDV